MLHRHAVALDVADPEGGRVEQQVDEVVVQQVDLVDVQDAPVRAGQQPGWKDVTPTVSKCPTSSEPVSRSSVAPTGSSTSRVGRDCAAAPAGCGPSGHCGSGAAGEHEKRQPATTSTGGRTAVSARTAVDFAVPFSPRTSTPPIAGEIALRMSASRMSSMATMALNGNWVTATALQPAGIRARRR